MSLRRPIQIASLAMFLCLLIAAAVQLPLAALDFYLRMDPLLVGGSALAGRVLRWGFVPAALVLLSGLLVGRGFCGYICPMGTTLDGSDALFGRRRMRHLPMPGQRWRRVKYLLLVFLLAAAAAGVSLVFLAAPLSLITRFYGTVIYPAVVLGLDAATNWTQPVAESLGMVGGVPAAVGAVRFDHQLVVLVFFGFLFVAAVVQPRFWCRNLCPAGAMLALVSRRPLIRRQVSDRCTACGRCAATCPMGAIDADVPAATDYKECIACTTCRRVCPELAVVFGLEPLRSPAGDRKPALSRRQFIGAGLVGAGAAAVGLTGLHSPLAAAGPGHVGVPGLIRPPGARPEIDFLARCVRCGECMLACPTNTLQPIGLAAGWPALFSPAVIARRGFCDPRCHRCADICPTGAIRAVGSAERVWAKIGTAAIERQRCLAWEHKKSCMVCDEVCPYDAVEFKLEPGYRFAVPHVEESRCAGCGFCEHYCPVQHRSAIVVTAMGEMRQNEGSFADSGKRQGLVLRLRATAPPETGESASGEMPAVAPGFDPE